MEKVKEVWVRFSDTETYYEKEGELLSGISSLDEAVYDVCKYELEGGEVYSPDGGKPDEQK